MVALLLALSLALPLTRPVPQPLQGGSLAEAADRIEKYPPVRPKTCSLAFLIDDEAELPRVSKALAELGGPDAPCRIVEPIDRSAAQPTWAFLVVEAPVGVDTKKLVAAVRKGAKRTERLMATAFDGDERLQWGQSGWRRDKLFTSVSEVRWATAFGRSYQIYSTPGKPKTERLAAQLGKSLGLKTPPPLMKHSFSWTLAEPVDAEAAMRAEKALLAIPGVESAHIDIAKRALAVTVALEGLDVLGAPLELPIAERSKATGTTTTVMLAMPKARFDTTPVFDALERENLAVVPATGGK